MDTIKGRDLDHIITQDGPLPVHRAVDYLIQAARDIEAVHARGIVHGDIKPGNLVVDATGIVRVLDPGQGRIVGANQPFRTTAADRLTQNDLSIESVDYMAPEVTEDSQRADQRSDIYSLGCTLHFLLTGREPFPSKTMLERMTAHKKTEAPSLRASRPVVPLALEACYQKMMAKRPDDRPGSMAEVIALLQKSTLPPEVVATRVAPPPKFPPEPKAANEAPLKRARQPKTKPVPSLLARRREREGLAIPHDFNLEDLVTVVPPEAPLAPTKPTTTVARPLKRSAMQAFAVRSRHIGAALLALGAAGLVLAVFVGLVVLRPETAEKRNDRPPPVAGTDVSANTRSPKLSRPAQPEPEPKTIFDGNTGKGWMLCNRAPLPPRNIQPDGLNPHRSGSYLVVCEQKAGDFVLEFDYKLSKKCNSGVFVRVSDLNNPVQTGIEVSLNDTRRGDDRDSGGFRGLVAPHVYAQKPSRQWNHMTITARGPRLVVSLNDAEVTSIDLDLWTKQGKRPDGSNHAFKDLAVARMARSGYLGFQDLGGDCWFKNITLKTITP